jgi:hypothetical protein
MRSHDPAGVDQDGAADDAFALLAVHLLRAPGVVGLDHTFLRVAQQLDRKVVLTDELAVRLGRVRADAQDDGAQRVELRFLL